TRGGSSPPFGISTRFRNRPAGVNPESVHLHADYSISVRLSEKPFAHLAVHKLVPTRQAFRHHRPGRYKPTRCCRATRKTLLIVSIILQARPALLLVCPTSPKHNCRTRLDGY